MIALANDCLVFELTSGERIPFSAEMISVELLGEAATRFDADFVRNAAASVFHHFKHDLGRETVTVAEFTVALETVLRGFGCTIYSGEDWDETEGAQDVDLARLARGDDAVCELAFYPRLRDALREQLRRSPGLVRFRGLRRCVKRLAGAQRWGPRCDLLREQILEFLRNCLTVEARDEKCSLVVE
ncbi:MAG TPA: hypothetical protein PKA41_16215 [Verrucomicrobiota bacterium]|nr:hypothetical protein [Verrucomicrobiota bacterium]